MNFAESLRAALKDRGMTQTDLAKVLGCVPSQVSKMCGGTRSPTEATMQWVAKGLDRTLQITLRRKRKGANDA